ncbi:hypothetical protein LJK87_47625 [Paenibacillus sp. P25]|nr:hypothetical protein LJK87_47625 [Paenibacillus sp. P25]
MQNIKAWFGPHPTVRLLQLAAFLRYIGQGIAVVDLSLYLKEMGWSGGAVGAAYGVALVRTLWVSFAGELNGHLGPKLYMILFESITAVAALAVTLSGCPVVLVIAVMVAGLGRGHTGSGSPAAPIERSWLGAYAKEQADHVFGMNALLGYVGLGIGALLAGLPSLWDEWLPGAERHRPLYALIALLALTSLLLILKVTGGRRKRSKGVRETASESLPLKGPESKKRSLQSSEDKKAELLKLALVVNGVAVALSGSMTSYWLAARFGASPE